MSALLEPGRGGVLELMLEQLLDLYPPEQQAQIRAASPAFLLKLDRLAGEILDVEAQGLPYARAVRDDAMGYPLMTRFHYGISALFQYELTPQMCDLVRTMLVRAETSERLEQARLAVFRHAVAAGSTKEGALLRFFLYEALLLNLQLACWDSPEVEASGTFIDFEWRAQDILRGWLKIPDAQRDDVRPLRGMVAEGLLWVRERVAERLHEAHGEQLTAIINELIPAVECARSLEARDAVIVRNCYAERLHEDVLESQQLVDRYPTLYRTPAAVDTRRHRLKLRIKPSSRRLVDELLRAWRGDDDERGK